jgi:hypothetical protein
LVDDLVHRALWGGGNRTGPARTGRGKVEPRGTRRDPAFARSARTVHQQSLQKEMIGPRGYPMRKAVTSNPPEQLLSCVA